MGYNVRFEGTSNHSTAAESHEVREALMTLVDTLKGQGHNMSTSFINDEPFNFQEADERARYDAESKEWADTVEAARLEAMGTQTSVQQEVAKNLGGDPNASDAPQRPPAAKGIDPHDSNTGTHQTKTVTPPPTH